MREGRDGGFSGRVGRFSTQGRKEGRRGEVREEKEVSALRLGGWGAALRCKRTRLRDERKQVEDTAKRTLDN